MKQEQALDREIQVAWTEATKDQTKIQAEKELALNDLRVKSPRLSQYIYTRMSYGDANEYNKLKKALLTK